MMRINRFSSKEYDAEVDLYYYGYRYYSPQIGKWMSRDPIGERGGINAYKFVKNSPPNAIDAHGLYSLKISPSSAPEGIPYTYEQLNEPNVMGRLVSRLASSCPCACAPGGNKFQMTCSVELSFHIKIESFREHYKPEKVYAHEQQHAKSIIKEVDSQIIPTLKNHENFKYDTQSKCEEEAKLAVAALKSKFGIIERNEGHDSPNGNNGRPGNGDENFEPIGPMPPTPSP